ncbi:MAG: hypothetical protein HZA32_00980 [Opitutae bacterium]|nr:hypothetical protein [Opitutae bacterium]
MWPWKKSKRSTNEWLASDRRERVRMILATLLLVGAIGAGIALAIHALTSH